MATPPKPWASIGGFQGSHVSWAPGSITVDGVKYMLPPGATNKISNDNGHQTLGGFTFDEIAEFNNKRRAEEAVALTAVGSVLPALAAAVAAKPVPAPVGSVAAMTAVKAPTAGENGRLDPIEAVHCRCISLVLYMRGTWDQPFLDRTKTFFDPNIPRFLWTFLVPRSGREQIPEHIQILGRSGSVY